MTKKSEPTKTPIGLSHQGIPVYCEDIKDFTMQDDPSSANRYVIILQRFHGAPVILTVYRDIAMSALSDWQKFCYRQRLAVQTSGESLSEPNDLLEKIQRLPRT